MKHSLAMLALAAFWQTSPPAHAHHSAVQFDFTIRDRTVTGVVKEFDVANPHTRIILEVSDQKGTRDIEFEGHSRNNYYRSGWRPHLVNLGDRVTLGIAPLKNGNDGGYVLTVATQGGDKF